MSTVSISQTITVTIFKLASEQ